MQTESAPGCVSNNVLCQPQEFGQDVQEVSKSEKFVTKEVGAHVNPADLRTKPLLRPKIEQLMKMMGYRFVEQRLERAGLRHADRCVHSSVRKEA